MEKSEYSQLEYLLCSLLIYAIISMFWLFFVSRIVLYNFQSYIEYKEKLYAIADGVSPQIYQNSNLRLREVSVVSTEI